MMNFPKLTVLLLAGLALVSCNKHTSEPAADQQEAKPIIVEDPFLKDVDAKQASELVKSESAIVVLDVRTPDEFAAGHIDGAINVDFNGDDFKAELEKFDKEKTYLMHCRSGGRSTAAKPAFTELGFKFIYHLDGGMLGWEEAGLPTTK